LPVPDERDEAPGLDAEHDGFTRVEGPSICALLVLAVPQVLIAAGCAPAVRVQGDRFWWGLILALTAVKPWPTYVDNSLGDRVHVFVTVVILRGGRFGMAASAERAGGFFPAGDRRGVERRDKRSERVRRMAISPFSLLRDALSIVIEASVPSPRGVLWRADVARPEDLDPSSPKMRGLCP